jgi:hypothetical protein
MDPKTTDAATSNAPSAAPPADASTARRTLEELLVAHREARRRRDVAVLGSPEHRAAVAEVGRLEVEMARVQREMQPPLV